MPKAGLIPKKYLLVQPVMMRVVVGLLPCLAGAVFFFGWRPLLVTLVALVAGTAAEAAFTLRQGKPVTSAVFVTCLIYSLSLPPTVPLWMVAVGIVFGVVFGKMAFGGFGYNVYNPAMVARCFVYISFPIALTARWVPPFGSPVQGLLGWVPPVDAVTSATPLRLLQAGQDIPLAPLFFGNISGSMGETSALLVLLGGLFIVYKKAAQWRLAVSCLLGAASTATVLYLVRVPGVPDPLTYLLAGSLLFGAFFVVTEPISGPKTKPGQWIYGAAIGSLTIVLRRYSNFPEGVMFSVLFMNTFVPLLDRAAKLFQEKRRAQATTS
ncbi:Na+-transporting NADH:ubiquinone oxidoreductase subunit B [Desulfacinum hydrothermale DSM 13146]|uniref:Na+-transporting NADH:ubiquinone oxidoreductase subunit B n=1 Tax=Desulfacinum hydrothermale DSM 13146 TaxID=1121390 RepID=A0A1W1XQT0_9BACT|nr:RnfABCDGE type electron transport complex subunit D [Desulfacinum hydrothermale]SMC25868.1 Na+-transporting NADH:ubiquinone oxidoreductase subunit B [Desulfacinum hydrothermale DSM 13146]